MKSESLQELYLEQLRDMYDAEHQLLKALPQLAKAASNEELQAAFEQHAEQTEEHIARLSRIFEELDEKPKGHQCQAMKGLIEESKSMIADLEDDPETLDAGLICAAQKIEHYEIATYGCLCTYAELLGHDEHADFLQDTLDEEKDTDESLTELAVSCINLDAVEDEEGEEDDIVKPKAGSKAGSGKAKEPVDEVEEIDEDSDEDEDDVDEEDEDADDDEEDEEEKPTKRGR